MAIEPTDGIWSKEAFLLKAQKYAQIMCSNTKDTWEYAFWSALLMEITGRAALANISPVLLAENKDSNNILLALGRPPLAPKFTPKSIDISEVFKRLEELIPQFNKDHSNFAILHMNLRNEELHTGRDPFLGLSSTKWQAQFYESCKILLDSMNESLELFFEKQDVEFINNLITASHQESAQSIRKNIQAYKTIWEEKTVEEKEQLTLQASNWATRQHGHRVTCPACSNTALVFGKAISEPKKSIDPVDNLIIEKQEYIPTHFECVACQLKINNYSMLTACGLADTYTATFRYEAQEYFQIEDSHVEFEPDYNDD